MCAPKLWLNLQRRYNSGVFRFVVRIRHRGHDPVTIHWSVMSTQVNTGVYYMLLDRYVLLILTYLRAHLDCKLINKKNDGFDVVEKTKSTKHIYVHLTLTQNTSVYMYMCLYIYI